MSSIRTHARPLTLAISCLAIGAGASAIASAGAATSATSHAAKPRVARGWSARRLAAQSVHGDLLIATEKGLVTVTFDRGIVKSVSGQQLTLTEGAKTATPKTVVLTIPSNARVRDNGKKATLSELTSDQRVLVVQAPKRTFVVARTPRKA
jgi:hypothetical protein